MKAKSLIKAMGTESAASVSASGPGNGKLKRKMQAASRQRKIKKVMQAKAKANEEMSYSEDEDEDVATNEAPKTPSKMVEKTNQKSKASEGKYANPFRYKLGQVKKNIEAKAEDMQAKFEKAIAKRKKKQSGSDDMDMCGPDGCKMGKPAPGTGVSWKGRN